MTEVPGLLASVALFHTEDSKSLMWHKKKIKQLNISHRQGFKKKCKKNINQLQFHTGWIFLIFLTKQLEFYTGYLSKIDQFKEAGLKTPNSCRRAAGDLKQGIKVGCGGWGERLAKELIRLANSSPGIHSGLCQGSLIKLTFACKHMLFPHNPYRECTAGHTVVS